MWDQNSLTKSDPKGSDPHVLQSFHIEEQNLDYNEQSWSWSPLVVPFENNV